MQTTAYSPNRRQFIRDISLLASGVLCGAENWAAPTVFPVVRVPEAERKFRSAAVERCIQRIASSMGNKELAWMFENCFPNTLDTTVDFSVTNGRPDTFMVTGDIHAMWLRDSTAQVWPYLELMKEDHCGRREAEWEDPGTASGHTGADQTIPASGVSVLHDWHRHRTLGRRGEAAT
jgi:hypothetical protein